MKDNEHENVKTLGYRLGQILAVVTVICLITLMVGLTVAILYKIF